MEVLGDSLKNLVTQMCLEEANFVKKTVGPVT